MLTDIFEDIIAHLGAAAMQRASSDDEIIADHIDAALARAKDGLRTLKARSIVAEEQTSGAE